MRAAGVAIGIFVTVLCLGVVAVAMWKLRRRVEEER